MKSTHPPVLLLVYDRIDQLRQCINCLLKNKEASCTSLFVYSDAAKTSKDAESVKLVRSYIQKISGFANVELIERKENLGGNENGRLAKRDLAERYSFFIILETDILVGATFLEFMRNGRDDYEKDKKIISITGYNIPNFKKKYKNDSILMSKLYSAWGTGVWSNKEFFETSDSYEKPFQEMNDLNLQKSIRTHHKYLSEKLKLIDNGEYLYDVLATYLCIKNNYYQLRPVESLVKNIGFDDLGEHCGKDSRFSKQTFSNQSTALSGRLEYSKENDDQILSFFYPTTIKTKRFVHKLLERILGKNLSYLKVFLKKLGKKRL